MLVYVSFRVEWAIEAFYWGCVTGWPRLMLVWQAYIFLLAGDLLCSVRMSWTLNWLDWFLYYGIYIAGRQAAWGGLWTHSCICLNFLFNDRQLLNTQGQTSSCEYLSFQSSLALCVRARSDRIEQRKVRRGQLYVLWEWGLGVSSNKPLWDPQGNPKREQVREREKEREIAAGQEIVRETEDERDSERVGQERAQDKREIDSRRAQE